MKIKFGMIKNLYEFDNREFHSIKELSQYTGVHEKTITARIRRGMSIAEACDEKDLRCSYYVMDNVEKSVKQICTEQSKNTDLIRNRLKYGYSLNDALNKPKKISRQGIPIVVHGILYNSISSAIKQFNLLKKESTIRRRLKEGMEPDSAFKFEE